MSAFARENLGFDERSPKRNVPEHVPDCFLPSSPPTHTTKQADLKFFAEMVAVRGVMLHMKDVATGRIQAHPDFFSFGMSALPALKLQYGADSKQYRVAQQMYSQFFVKV